MPPTISPSQHPHRVLLHNEIHARPPEAMSAPLAIAHVVMLADAAEREASRAHVASIIPTVFGFVVYDSTVLLNRAHTSTIDLADTILSWLL